MDNINNNYRNIIERAIFAGIITEEDKHFYLSAIEEENDSELSELESHLNTTEAINTSFNFKQNNEDSDVSQSTSNDYNNMNKTIENRTLKNDDCQSFQSDSTIENYSILDITHHKNDLTEESDTDVSSSAKERVHSTSPKKLTVSRPETKVMKNPRKNQIVDFNVPIYFDVRKKSVIKPHVSHSMNLAQHEVLNISTCKRKSSNLLGSGTTQNVCKWSLPKVKASLKKDKNIPPTYLKNIFSSSICTNQFDQFDDVDTNIVQGTENTLKRKSVHTCSNPVPKEDDSEPCKEYINGVVNNREEVEQDKSEYRCVSQKHMIKNLRSLKVHKDLLSQQPVSKVKLKQRPNSDAHRNSHGVKSKTKGKMPVVKYVRKCKRCRCNCACQSMEQYLNTMEDTGTFSESGTSEVGVLETSSSNEKNSERVLNLNIICQFYQDDETKQWDAHKSQDSKIASNSPDGTEKLKNKASKKTLNENEKTKRSKQIQQLSKIFANMKINRKQKQSDSHSTYK